MVANVLRKEKIFGEPARYWHELGDGRLQCDLCPRFCRLRDGQRGLCFVRGRAGDEILLTAHGRSSGFRIDPIEKKPLNHFLPGTPVLSFGTPGCNLACKFCQNWDLSKARELERLQVEAGPAAIADLALSCDCPSVAFTYNDPVVYLEFAVDVARACRERGLKSVAVTAGYITETARDEFFDHMDAANVDLKAFSERFYRKICGGHLQPVLETLDYLANYSDAWLEITTLLIPGENDSDAEVDRMTQWIAENLGFEGPLHFTAFHPDWKLTSRPPTPPETLRRAREIARRNGLLHVYTGNVRDLEGSSTYCGACGDVLIARDRYELLTWNVTARDGSGCCSSCGTGVPGVFGDRPGDRRARAQAVRIAAA
jgi:pyruvate formate lyase activating enzyme